MAEGLDWKLTSEGHIELMSLAGFEAGNYDELSLLRLEYFESDAAEDARDLSVLQLRMLPSSARIVAEALIKSAEAAEAVGAPTGPSS